MWIMPMMMVRGFIAFFFYLDSESQKKQNQRAIPKTGTVPSSLHRWTETYQQFVTSRLGGRAPEAALSDMLKEQEEELETFWGFVLTCTLTHSSGLLVSENLPIQKSLGNLSLHSQPGVGTGIWSGDGENQSYCTYINIAWCSRR